VLAVVDQEHAVGTNQNAGQGFVERSPGRLHHRDGRSHCGDDRVHGGDLAQIDEPRAIWTVACDLLHGMRRQSGLSDPARPGNGHQAVLAHQRAKLGRLGVTAHELVGGAGPVLEPSGTQQVELLGPPRQRAPIGHPELADQGGDVGLDGAHREREPLSDLEVRQVSGDQDEDVALPVGHGRHHRSRHPSECPATDRS
jgi:hypothetical protein